MDRFHKKYGWRLDLHSVDEVDRFNAGLKKLEKTDNKGNSYFDDSLLTNSMRRFIQNERALCNPPEAPIWMGDYTFKPIGEVKVGDEVIGWERELRPPTKKQFKNGKNYERMKRTRVVAVGRRIGPIVKVTMESGRVIRCTPDHLWSNGATYRQLIEWINPKIGRTLRHVVDIYPNDPPDLRTAAWLGGFYDGEGHKNGISQNREINPENCAHMVACAERLDLPHTVIQADNTHRKGRDRNADQLFFTGGYRTMARFAAWCKPAKMRNVDRYVLKNLVAKPDKIVNIEPDGEGEVVSLQTETGNYVAWGYASKNCALSAEYFLTRYFWLTESDIQHFSFRSGQSAFFSVMQILEDLGVSIDIQCLKARKQGITTLVEGCMTHASLMIPGTRCSIGSADDQKTQVMMEMMYGALEHMPWWLSPTQTRDKRAGRALLQFSHIGTMVVIQHGAMRGGIGQGTTPNRVHLSEVCDYTNPVAQIEEGLFKAVPTTPDTLMVLESTGNGNTGWWAEQWRANKENYWKGRARMLPLFLPWFMTPELYPTANWMQKFPFPAGWRRNQTREVEAMTNKAEAYVRNTEVLRRILGDKWRLPDEQMWYWQFNYDDAKLRRTEKSWSRQMPVDDFDALVGDHDSVYGWEVIADIQTKREKRIELFGILGGGIHERHDPAPIEVDYSRSRIAVDWRTPNGIPIEWMLMPLTGNVEDVKFDPLKKLIVFERPQKGARYSIGVDPGTGVGGDRTAICVWRTGHDAFPDIQVAEFASDDIGNTEIFAWVAAIAAWYGQFYEEDSTVRIIIEQKRKYGDSCYHALKLHGFKNHHKFRMYDKKTLRERPSVNPREGWFTNEWSRPMLLDTFKHAVNNGWVKVNSRWLLSEMEGHEQRMTEGGKTRADHASGKHDDRLFAAAMGHFTLHDLDVLIEREHKRCQAPTGEVEWELNTQPWRGPMISNSAAEDFLALYAE